VLKSYSKVFNLRLIILNPMPAPAAQQVEPFVIIVERKYLLHVVLKRAIESLHNRCLQHRTHRIMIDAMFFYESLHVSVVKFFFHIGCKFFGCLPLFRIISAIALAVSLPLFLLSGMVYACLLNASMMVSM